MQARGGYALILDPNAPRAIERDTCTCGHCGKIVMLHDQQGRRLESVVVHCHGCDTRICVPCAERPMCDPLEKKLERSEARGALLRSMGIE